MVCAAASLLLSCLAMTSVLSRPMHAGIDYERYLQDKDSVASELDQWLTKYGEIGRAEGWIPPSESRSAEEVAEDRRQRFFMAKQLLPKLSREQPAANFSTDTPFTLMTEAEFATYVKNSYVGKGNSDSAIGSVRAADIGDEHESGKVDSTENLDFQTLERSNATRQLQEQTQQGKDWSNSPCNAPVQDQGACGSCWAFATVGAVETAQCLSRGGGNGGGQSSVVKYSEQHLASCDRSNYGCDGGVPVYAFRYIQQNGLCTSSQVPYSSASGRLSQCASSCQKTQIPIKQVVTVSPNEANLVNVISRQPVVLAVSSGNAVWKQYRGGVVSSCPTTQLDHAVIAIGYDRDTIKIKNSWGSRWGENGYIRLKRGTGGRGTCSMLSDMSYPQM